MKWVRIPKDEPWLIEESRRQGKAVLACRIFQCTLEHGHLTAIAAYEMTTFGKELHVSMSGRTNENPPRPWRRPTGEEIQDFLKQLTPNSTFEIEQYPGEPEHIVNLWEKRSDKPPPGPPPARRAVRDSRKPGNSKKVRNRPRR